MLRAVAADGKPAFYCDQMQYWVNELSGDQMARSLPGRRHGKGLVRAVLVAVGPLGDAESEAKMKRPSNQWLIVICVFLIGNSLWLAGCAQQGLAARQLMPTPTGVATLTPIPTNADSKPVTARPYRITPLPGEKVRVGDITEVDETKATSAPVSPRYSVRTERRGQVDALFVRDSKTGREIRLGDDQGNTRLEAITDEYVIWRQVHYGDDKTAIQTGLYAHVLATGQEKVIAQEPGYPWSSKTDGQWVAYLFPGKGDSYFTQLRAHNLKTGEDFQLSQEVPYNRPGEYYAISGNRIVWVEVEPSETTPKWMIRVHDLTTHTTHTLKVPKVVSPVDLSLSSDILVWEDQDGTNGYDLKEDAPFIFPLIPPGWENLPVQVIGPVTVRDNHLYWSFGVNKHVYHVTAPIIRDK
jgi:hypothetical protein